MMSTTPEDTPIRMGKSKKVDRLDASRFQAPGINYKGKLVGVEDVPGPRGDKMCQVAMAKLKAAVKTIGEHKLKIVVNISLNGVRIVEEKSENIIYFHPVQRISFISRDPGDSRAFGYVYGREDGSHQFYGIKTEKVAENIVLNLRDLFQIIYEMKKHEKEDIKEPITQEAASGTSTRKSYDSKNGLEQLNVFSSSMSTYSPGQRTASKFDSPAALSSHRVTSQSPLTDDRMSATLPTRGFQRGVLGHHASEVKRSMLVREQSPLATKQYSSMTAAECRQFYHQQAGSSTMHRQLSTSDVDPTATVSPLMKLHSHYSSVQSPGWFPVALPPPASAGTGATSARRSATHPTNGLASCPVNPSATWSPEGWAVFDSTEELVGLSTVVEDGCGAESRNDSFLPSTESRFEFQMDTQSSEKPFGEFYSTVAEVGNSLTVTTDLEIKKSLSPESARTGRSSGSVRVSGSYGAAGSSTSHGGAEGCGPSSKSPSGVPTLASPESLSDEEESSPDVSSFPSPNTPPPPLPLDTVVDFTLQPPVPPPRPKPKDVAVTRLISESAESPIYGNLPLANLLTQNSFTLPRPRLSQADGDHTTKRPRPIQVGYDLTMPRPRPAPKLSGPRPQDDLILIGERCPTRRPFLRGKTLTSCQNIDMEEATERNAESTPKNSEKSPAAKDVTPISANCANDPFAICLVSRLSKPQTFVTRSAAAMEEGLIHTSISPIPRPRPRQRSAPSTSRDQSSGTSKSVSPLSNKARQNPSPLSSTTGSTGGVKRSDPIRSNPIGSDPIRSNSIGSDPIRSNPIGSDPVRLDQKRTEQRTSGHRKAESLSCDVVTRAPERVHKWSLGSSRSDPAPDPFNHVDPFATETFSDDPFSTQPDPLSLESPSSDPFSREFPKTASAFHTRAVTVEMGDVFEDATTAVVGLGDREHARMTPNKTTGEPTSDSFQQMCKETDVKGFSESEGLFMNIIGKDPSVSRSDVGETSLVASTITVRGEQLAEALKICCVSTLKLDNQSSVEGREVTGNKDEVISCDGKSTANAETPQVHEDEAIPSSSERQSVFLKGTESGCKISSLEALITEQNPAMGILERGDPEGGIPTAPSLDHTGGFEDSFDPIPVGLPSDPSYMPAI